MKVLLSLIFLVIFPCAAGEGALLATLSQFEKTEKDIKILFSPKYPEFSGLGLEKNHCSAVVIVLGNYDFIKWKGVAVLLGSSRPTQEKHEKLVRDLIKIKGRLAVINIASELKKIDKCSFFSDGAEVYYKGSMLDLVFYYKLDN